LPFDTGSEQSFTTISNWMEACADHKECSEDEVLLPKRLVDVGKAGSSQVFPLEIRLSLQHSDKKY